MSRLIVVAAVVTLCTVSIASAHHSTAMYDTQHPVTIQGVVNKVEWTNPHAHLYLTVTDDKGATTEWDVELMSLNHLRGYGWTARTVKPGDKISATGSAAKSGDPAMIASTIALPDGSKIKS
jgi:tRNA(Ile2) C34 agmatinyltransferase TiaS